MAKAELEAEAKAAAAAKAKEQAGRPPRKNKGGRPPKPPSETPPDKAQHNFTDPESRIMRTRQTYEQAYNCQAAEASKRSEANGTCLAPHTTSASSTRRWHETEGPCVP